jgi:hypothetical protein
MGTALALCAGAFFTSPAKAQCVSHDGVSNNAVAPLAGDATRFAIEGKITGFDRTARTLRVNGLTLTLPAGLMVNTLGLDRAPNLSFDALTAPAKPASRNILGGTLIAQGTIEKTVTPAGKCLTFTADSVFISNVSGRQRPQFSKMRPPSKRQSTGVPPYAAVSQMKDGNQIAPGTTAFTTPLHWDSSATPSVSDIERSSVPLCSGATCPRNSS